MNGRKVYNVRFYSLSIIQSWKKQRGGGKEDKSERKKTGEGEEEVRGGREERREEVCVKIVKIVVDVGGRLHFSVHLLNVAEIRSVAAMFCSLKASPDV